jgi:hypothetical protein
MYFVVWCVYQHAPLLQSERTSLYFNRVGVRPFLLLEVAEHAALGCWFVVTLCVAVLLKSIWSERYLVE